VPLDLFDGQGSNGTGSIAPDQISYINADLTNRAYDQQLSADIALSGALGWLPAGSVKWSFGAEYRRESAGVTLDPLTQQGIIGDGGGVALNQESFTASEAFVEAEAPLLAGEPGVRALDISLGARYSHFSNFGNATPLQAGLHWNIVRALTVRGSYAQVFRAPGTHRNSHAPRLSRLTRLHHWSSGCLPNNAQAADVLPLPEPEENGNEIVDRNYACSDCADRCCKGSSRYCRYPR
jgi:outer membrane receptor protein involved in Fe transport